MAEYPAYCTCFCNSFLSVEDGISEGISTSRASDNNGQWYNMAVFYRYVSLVPLIVSLMYPVPPSTTFHIDILIKSNIDWNFLNHPGVVPSFNMTSIKLINISQSDMFSVNLGRETRRMNFQHFTTTLLLHQTCSFQWKSASLSCQKRLCVCMYSQSLAPPFFSLTQ